MEKKSSYSYKELINCGNGELFGPGNAKLPLPPMLMFDRIIEVKEDNGAFKKGSITAELDINTNELIDLEKGNVDGLKIKKNLPGKKIKSIEVLVKIENSN